MEEEIESRPAQEADFDFLYRLHRDTFREHVEQTWGWVEKWQAEHFRNWVDLSRRRIVLSNGKPIGSFGVQQCDTHVFVEYMAILPSMQRRGIGTVLLLDIMRGALQKRMPIRLNVLKVNRPAFRFYEKMGFRVVGGDEHRHYLEAQAHDSASSPSQSDT